MHSDPIPPAPPAPPARSSTRPLRAGISDAELPARVQADTLLKAESILLEEFKHASTSAHDALQGHSNLFYVYILGVGALVTFAGALFGLYSATQNYVLLTLSITVAGLLGGAVSFAFYVKSLDLRREYREHLDTMAAIRDFYIRELETEMPHVRQAFRVHRPDAAGSPPGGTLALEGAIALLGSFFFGEAAREGWNVWMTFATGRTVSPAISGPGRLLGLLVVVVALVAHVAFYQWKRQRAA
jgi:hypothetical protein